MFGEDAESSIETIASFFGEPDEDTGWEPSFSSFGTCPGEEARKARWANLAVVFISAAEANPNWTAPQGETMWGASMFRPSDAASLEIFTPEGVGVGSTVDWLRDSYPDLSIMYDDWFSAVTGETYYRFWTADGIRGRTTGPDGSDIVEMIDIGGECGE